MARIKALDHDVRWQIGSTKPFNIILKWQKIERVSFSQCYYITCTQLYLNTFIEIQATSPFSSMPLYITFNQSCLTNGIWYNLVIKKCCKIIIEPDKTWALKLSKHLVLLTCYFPFLPFNFLRLSWLKNIGFLTKCE